MPWSDSKTSDDKILDSTKCFNKQFVVCTEKLDGECTTMYRDYIHARSIYSNNHESQTWVKKMHSSIKHLIPENYRICGENMYAKHSIKYDHLTSYFYVFAIFNGDICINWYETIQICADLDLYTPMLIYLGLWNDTTIKDKFKNFKPIFSNEIEGFVVRNVSSFHISDFGKNVAKYVRANHVQTDKHWKENWAKNTLFVEKALK